MSEQNPHHTEEIWKFILSVQIPTRSLQLVVKISDDPKDQANSIVFFYFAVMCAPITKEMLKASEPLQAWCTGQDLNLEVESVAYTWSADGHFKKAVSYGCVLWSHASIEQFTLPRRNAHTAALRIGSRLAKIMKGSCGTSENVELLFDVHGGDWLPHGTGAIRARTVG